MQTYYPDALFPDSSRVISGFKSRIKTERWDIEKFGSRTEQAGNLALKELKQGRSVVILVPPRLSAEARAVWKPGARPLGIYLRFDDAPTSLISLRVDTLILVRPEELKNEHVARVMLNISMHPKIIRLSKHEQANERADP